MIMNTWRGIWLWLRPRIGAGLIIAGGVVATVWLAIRAQDTEEQLGGSEAAYLALISSVLNVGGATLLARLGRADPSHARSAVRRLLDIIRMVQSAGQDLDKASRNANVGNVVGVVAAQRAIVSIQVQLGTAVKDWNDVHPEALREIVDESTPEQ